MNKILPYFLVSLVNCNVIMSGQVKDSIVKPPEEKRILKFNLNNTGTHFLQAVFLNQTWLRFNQSNDGSTRFSKEAPQTFDIGLRRTRIQLLGQISDRTFIYFQFGQNNFNNTAGYSAGNRKIASFFHDALCEYKLTGNNGLKIGAGLTILNGLSRFSQPSVGTIMTLDVPVFLQYSVDQTDQFNRRLAVYARGQIQKLDYRVYFSDPFPVNSNGLSAPPPGKNASFVNYASFANGRGPGLNKQFGAYLAWNFLENEPHVTPYMTGTYLGSKKIWNLAAGAVYQNAATWILRPDANNVYTDTAFSDMLHLGLESFLDIPLNEKNGSALNAFIGYYNTNYGKNYLRYNGVMNPATGSAATNMIQANAYGNAFPMFGTGQIIYSQFGILLPEKNNGRFLPYISGQYANYQALQNKAMLVYDIGLNWLIKGHLSKLSLDYQNRPLFYYDSAGILRPGKRKSCVVLQYQITI